MTEVPKIVIWVLSGLSALAIVVIFLLSIASATRDDFQFFPPPNNSSWQHKVFVWLFRFYLYPLIAVTLIAIEIPSNSFDVIRWIFGGVLLIVGFGLAFRITYQMGWRNAFGERLGLKTKGWFSKSRNPIYVATWLGLIGWAFVVNSVIVTALLFLWALMYLAAPIVEEPWLEQQYGDAYRDYRKQIPRFF